MGTAGSPPPSSWWDSFYKVRKDGPPPREAPLIPTDKAGALLLNEFDDCMQEKKFRVFIGELVSGEAWQIVKVSPCRCPAGIAAISIPISLYRKVWGAVVWLLGVVWCGVRFFISSPSPCSTDRRLLGRLLWGSHCLSSPTTYTVRLRAGLKL